MGWRVHGARVKLFVEHNALVLVACAHKDWDKFA